MPFKSDMEAVVLGLLQHETMHGYEIVRRLRELEVISASMAESQLYPVLHKLELGGYIESVWIPQEGKPARKVYSMTPSGHRALETKRSEWSKFSSSVAAALAPAKPTSEAFHG